jgi:hypothetical protein
MQIYKFFPKMKPSTLLCLQIGGFAHDDWYQNGEEKWLISILFIKRYDNYSVRSVYQSREKPGR